MLGGGDDTHPWSVTKGGNLIIRKQSVVKNVFDN